MDAPQMPISTNNMQPGDTSPAGKKQGSNPAIWMTMAGTMVCAIGPLFFLCGGDSLELWQAVTVFGTGAVLFVGAVFAHFAWRKNQRRDGTAEDQGAQ